MLKPALMINPGETQGEIITTFAYQEITFSSFEHTITGHHPKERFLS